MRTQRRMTDKEIIQALRCCANGLGHDDACENCKVGEIKDRREYIEFAAANVIERLTAENAKAEAERDALIEQIKERHDCLDCKHNDFCEFDGAILFACLNCVTKNCPCAGCYDYSRWEWRGLPEEPEEGGKA